MSGILVQVNPDFLTDVIECIMEIEGCEYHFSDNLGRIIVTIEAENTEKDIEVLKKLQVVNHVISADMIYTYSESELQSLRENIDSKNPVPEWLNDPEVTAEKIKYQGDLKRKY